ncbi:ParB N-terminal domain-containing protein, partial [Streptomyces sp. NPDC005953]|uniref:ParB N-terminal domain-containing protein n=1 Tax=Streptomyces sp. NPDC005953 TaxID=3156719 RepID=UPI0033CEF4EA
MTARRTVGIDEIEVGRRARVDVGDLTDLIQSIADVGLLQPVVITDDNRLIAGGRRIEACRKLAMTEVPVIVAAHLNDAASLLSAERDENTCRKDMTPSELVAIGRSLEDLERPKAEARRRDGQSRGGAIHAAQVLGLPQKTEHLSEDLAAEFHAGKTDVVVGKALGVGASTYYRAKTLVKAAETGDERAAAAVADMDRTGKVTPAYNAYRGRTTTPSGTAAPREQAPPLKNANGRRYPQR